MSRREEKTTFLLAHGNYTRTRDALKRRENYMLKNRDGEYSVQDLTLVRFAIETADSLATYMMQMADRCDAKTRADERYKKRCRLAQVRQLYENFVKVETEFEYRDKRDLIEEMQELEFLEIACRQHIDFMKDGKLEKEDREAEERAKIKERRRCIWRHEFLHLYWYESAIREDIVNGEKQDFSNMVAAWKFQVSSTL